MSMKQGSGKAPSPQEERSTKPAWATTQRAKSSEFWAWEASDGYVAQTQVVHHLTPANREQEMAIRAKAFGMKIQYHNRSRLPAELEGDATYVSFDELLANADVLSLNLALNASTRHIIGATEFTKMKDGVVIVNTARGALIDEKALVAALDSGKVCNAAHWT